MNDAPQPDRVKSYFDSKAAAYWLASESGLWRIMRRREESTVFSLLGPVNGANALDLGCGAGYYTRGLLLRNAETVTAVDSSRAMMENLRQYPKVTCIVGDAASTEIDGRFSAVICAGLLEFVADPLAVLKNARAHVVDRAQIVCLVPPATFAGRLYRAFHRLHGFEIRLFSDADFRDLGERAGWQLTAVRRATPYARAHCLTAGGT